jgi:hypothetical protein
MRRVKIRVRPAAKVPAKVPHLAVLLDGRQVLTLASAGLPGLARPSPAAVVPAIPETVVGLIERV